jgi:hypothetical protein
LKKLLIISSALILFGFYCSKENVTQPDKFANKDPQLIGAWIPEKDTSDTLRFTSTKYLRTYSIQSNSFIVNDYDGNWYTTNDTLIIQINYIEKTRYTDNTKIALISTEIQDSIPINYFKYRIDTSEKMSIQDGTTWFGFNKIAQ